MKDQNKYHIRVLFFLFGFLAGCSTVNQTSLTNLAYLYQPDQQFARMKCAVYHANDTTSDLFVRINYSELVYEKDPFSGLYQCSYRVSWKMMKSYESGEVLAGGSEVAGDSINYGRNTGTIHSFIIPARFPENYVVEVELFDFHRNKGIKSFVNISKSDRNGRQNFLVFDRNASLLFKNIITPGEPFRVMSGDLDWEHLFVSCYFREFPIARPPFLEDREPVFNYRPDSLFGLTVLAEQTDWITFDREGFYHFRKDTTQREGLTLFVFGEGYPELYTAEQLREPLRYISTKREYDSLLANDQPKAAVDDFWLKTAGSPERAKMLIQKYYGNVEEANQYFASYQAGWKTDRGLIYTVLGKPNYVYRTDKSEEWIYGEPQNRSSLTFTFVKVKNPFTENDFMLLRSPTYKDPWYITVQSWRR